MTRSRRPCPRPRARVQLTDDVLDELTVRWSWSKPNRFFIPALAAANQLFIYRPAHYLKQFHQKYADPEELGQTDGKFRGMPYLALSEDQIDLVVAYLIERK